MEELVRFLISAFLTLRFSIHAQFINRPFVITHRRADELLPTSKHYSGNLILPVDGRNATLDCWYYDKNPAQCAKIPHCTYHCKTGLCKVTKDRDPKFCSQYCLNTCACKQAGCYSHLGVSCLRNPKCQFDTPSLGKNGPPITLRISNRFPFSLCPDARTLLRISPKRGDFEFLPVISVNFGGERHVDELGWIFQADADVEFEDPDGMRGNGVVTEESVYGVAEKDKPLYATYVKGTAGRGEKKCLTYIASLCEEGNYLLDLKVMEPEYDEAGMRLFDVKINDVVVLDELDIIAWTKKKGRVAEIFVRFYFSATEEVIINGEVANVTNGDVKISFCTSDCPEVPNPNFVVSAFQVMHWQRSVDEFSLQVGHRGNPCKCRIMAGKEYNYETTMCTTPRECTPCIVKSNCMRADAIYVTGGSACKNRYARGSCIIEEVVNAVNINGRAHQDSRGIRYLGDVDSLFEDPFKIRYDLDGDIINYGTCSVDPFTNVAVTGVVTSDAILYETFTRSLSTGGTGMCMNYKISDLVKQDGKYELVVKTVEPYYVAPGKRSFSIRLFHDEMEFDQPVVPDLDILKFSEPCEATDIVVNFQVSDGGSKVVIPGFPPRQITDERMKVGFCLSTCSANISQVLHTYDTDFIVSAFYIARISDKIEPHVGNSTLIIGGPPGGGGGGGGSGGSSGAGGSKGGAMMGRSLSPPAPEAQNKLPPGAQNKPPPGAQNKPPPGAQNKPPPEAQNKIPPGAQNKPPPEAQNKPPPEAKNKPPPEAQNKLPPGSSKGPENPKDKPTEKPKPKDENKDMPTKKPKDPLKTKETKPPKEKKEDAKKADKKSKDTEEPDGKEATTKKPKAKAKKAKAPKKNKKGTKKPDGKTKPTKAPKGDKGLATKEEKPKNLTKDRR